MEPIHGLAKRLWACPWRTLHPSRDPATLSWLASLLLWQHTNQKQRGEKRGLFIDYYFHQQGKPRQRSEGRRWSWDPREWCLPACSPWHGQSAFLYDPGPPGWHHSHAEGPSHINHPSKKMPPQASSQASLVEAMPQLVTPVFVKLTKINLCPHSHLSLLYRYSKEVRSASRPGCCWVDKQGVEHMPSTTVISQKRKVKFARKWVELENSILSGASQALKDKHCMFSHICGY